VRVEFEMVKDREYLCRLPQMRAELDNNNDVTVDSGAHVSVKINF
jgi:hypothetical protein